MLLVLLSESPSQHHIWAVRYCTNSNAAQRRTVPDQARDMQRQRARCCLPCKEIHVTGMAGFVVWQH